MSYDEMITGLKALPREEKRADLSDYLEIVFSRDGMTAASVALESFFGEPFKKAGERPNSAAVAYTAEYCGIQSQQTLYVNEADGNLVLAMIWPWGSGQAATVKVARQKRDK